MSDKWNNKEQNEVKCGTQADPKPIAAMSASLFFFFTMMFLLFDQRTVTHAAT